MNGANALLKADGQVAPAVAGAERTSLKLTHYLWWMLERRIKDSRTEQIAPNDRQRLLDELTDWQTEIMQRMTDTRAQSVREIYFKLAIWRWDEFGPDPDLLDTTRTERLCLSAYNDLRRMLGMREEFPELMNGSHIAES